MEQLDSPASAASLLRQHVTGSRPTDSWGSRPMAAGSRPAALA